MPSIRFPLNISPDDYLAYYRGDAKQVAVRVNGQTFAFPANRLRPFVTQAGVRGHFELNYDDNNKFVSLVKLDSPHR